MASKWLIFRRLFKYSSFILDIIEFFVLRKLGQKKSNYPTVYIIGPPRTGSTVLYQLITNYFDVLYIDNLADTARNNLFVGLWLSQKVFKNKAHNCFSSNLGRTETGGWHAPNEGLFWYRYLPRNKHYVKRHDVKDFKKKKMLAYHKAVKNKFNKPLIIKNLSFSMRLDFINSLEPDSKIIYIKRNPFFTAQSILNVKKSLDLQQNKIWSIKPPNYEELEKMPEIKQVVAQIYFLQQQIEFDLNKFAASQVLRLNYENLGDNLNEIIHSVGTFIKADKKIDEGMINNIIVKNQINVPEKMKKQIEEEIKKYTW